MAWGVVGTCKGTGTYHEMNYSAVLHFHVKETKLAVWYQCICNAAGPCLCLGPFDLQVRKRMLSWERSRTAWSRCLPSCPCSRCIQLWMATICRWLQRCTSLLCRTTHYLRESAAVAGLGGAERLCLLEWVWGLNCMKKGMRRKHLLRMCLRKRRELWLQCLFCGIVRSVFRCFFRTPAAARSCLGPSTTACVAYN